ncbi:hypothetical protein BCJMU51_5461 [Bacillus cereus]|uniref:hypothetical protein n=1 Tax=Bacillus cereus TaxID=1396 RepID=UPI001F31D7FE|nr:hypothetical protein [Bacillus cereus]BCB40543.1 hypothetical protein BCM0045_5438 [Bacillus cereus]BCC03379.1 hypothetical protein BCM0057_5461 [Bacillus cereus]BCC26898.1 hypothetical protein BCM0079_5491 [Bacillus cereus]BCC38458.1 hypothetical protein BCM0105_5448 [Bacillus cereus]BCC44256.1 hypothetical protein BCJMU01_5423 [Bacillus cereus]
MKTLTHSQLLKIRSENFKKREIKDCPKCGIGYSEYPAISRVDNKTEICPKCGQEEAYIPILLQKLMTPEEFRNFLKLSEDAGESIYEMKVKSTEIQHVDGTIITEISLVNLGK